MGKRKVGLRLKGILVSVFLLVSEVKSNFKKTGIEMSACIYAYTEPNKD